MFTRFAPWWPLVLSLAIALPHEAGGVFDGLPFSRWPEFVAFLVVLPAAFSSRLRRFVRRSATRRHHRAALLAWSLSVLALLLALVLRVAGGPSGFSACYRSAVPDQPSTSCERSYERLFRGNDLTRVDGVVDFGPDDWNLSFMNSNRFNYYSWVPGQYLRNRLPFTATWTGKVALPVATTVTIHYVGEGSLDLAGSLVPLPAAYGEPGLVTHDIPPGEQRLLLTYRFDDGSRAGAAVRGPGATLRLVARPRDDPGADPTPLAVASPPPVLLVTRWVADGLIIGLVAVLGLVVLLALSQERAALVAGGAASAAVAWLGARDQQFLMLTVAWVGVACRLALAGRRRARGLLAAYAAGGMFVMAILTGHGLAANGVFVRPGGSDWLTYESLARSILETGSLRGGEDVFYYQPGSRYIRFGLHTLFGDGDWFAVGFELLALNVSVLWLLWIGTSGRPRWLHRLFALVAVSLLLGLANSRAVIELIAQGASETWTWILLPLSLGLLFGRSLERYRTVGAAALAVSLITRFNQGPALALVFAVFLYANRRAPRQRQLVWLATFAMIALMPLAHNLYYGGAAVLMTTSASIPDNLSNPVSASDAATWWARTRDHLDALLGIGQYRLGLSPVLMGLQLAYATAVVAALVRRPHRGVWLGLSVVPVAYLAVHLVYQVDVYYPRHIVAGYLAMGAVMLLGIGNSWQQRDR